MLPWTGSATLQNSFGRAANWLSSQGEGLSPTATLGAFDLVPPYPPCPGLDGRPCLGRFYELKNALLLQLSKFCHTVGMVRRPKKQTLKERFELELLV